MTTTRPQVISSNDLGDSTRSLESFNSPSTKVQLIDSNKILAPSSSSSKLRSRDSFGNRSTSDNNHGWSSGASTPKEDMSDSRHNPKSLAHSTSILGLDKMIEAKIDNSLTNNIVHMEVPFGKPIEEVYEGVHDGPVLGSGISGLVRLCTHKATGAQYAVKCLDLGLVETDEGLNQLRQEIAIMCQLDHPNIIRLEEVYESHSEIYLVQELCLGGELFDRLDEQPDYHYSEAQCAKLVKQMLCSVRYIHSKGIIHRDLKLENFLFSSVHADSELKMIDFGLSKHFQYGEVHHETVGTPYTVAPEVIQGTYDERCDVWAIGVITYLLLSGDPPFGGCGGPESLFQVRNNILQGKFKFEPADVWEHVSQEAKDFIRMLLVTDPNMRPTAKQCQKSPWLHKWANKSKLESDTRLNANVVKALVNFKEYSDMRKLLCEVLSFTLMPDQITDLRKEFEKLDTDGSGEISLSVLKKVLMQEAGAGSLGALGEDEVEDIFNAMRVRTTETHIHWHEFIAAGLSQCKVDERNLRLAFDRLDSNHKGYITFDNVMDLMGRDGVESEDKMRVMWSDSMKACNSNNAQITYDDFLLLMKGQTKTDFKKTQKIPIQPVVNPPMLGLNGRLDVLHECTSISEGTGSEDETPIIDTTLNISSMNRRNSTGSSRKSSDGSIPDSSFRLIPGIDNMDDIEDDMPPNIDDDGDFDQKISDTADERMKKKQDVLSTPPQSPFRQALGNAALLNQIDPIADFSRRRSRSVDDKDLEGDANGEEEGWQRDIRRSMMLPEHTHDTKEIEKVIHDETLTPLVVNRQLYRAHRKMRHAVLEASKRFEDEQMRRTKAELQAKQAEKSGRKFGAGLVMRRGHKKEVSSETIRTLMVQRRKAHETVVEDAAKKSGRATSRRGRMKTVSDMSQMMAAISADDSGTSAAATLETEPTRQKPIIISHEPEILLHDITKPEPTVPGVFRKTNDPFKVMGQNMMGLFGDEGKLNQQDMIQRGSETKKNGSSLKLSLSDGELNVLDNAPNSPDSPNIKSSNSPAKGFPEPPLL